MLCGRKHPDRHQEGRTRPRQGHQGHPPAGHPQAAPGGQGLGPTVAPEDLGTAGRVNAQDPGRTTAAKQRVTHRRRNAKQGQQHAGRRPPGGRQGDREGTASRCMQQHEQHRVRD